MTPTEQILKEFISKNPLFAPFGATIDKLLDEQKQQILDAVEKGKIVNPSKFAGKQFNRGMDYSMEIITNL